MPQIHSVEYILNVVCILQPAVDDRLGGAYENVPTVDIHTNQIGWEPHWLEILKSYIGPYSGKVFEGYYTEVRKPSPQLLKNQPVSCVIMLYVLNLC